MRSSIFKQAAEFLQKRKNAKKWLAVFLCLAVVVTTGTLAALKLNGHAMTKTTREIVCSYEVHKHTEDCYKKVDGKKQLVCGYADYVVHTHNDDCYNEDGELICQLPEIKEHKHTDDCYKQEKVLTCGKEEAEAHEHTDNCYKVEKVLTCGKEESEGHTHGDACYDENGNLICEKEESESHTHSDDCYTEEKTLVCEKEETKGHKHTDKCYTEEKVLACGELELHTHTDECYETLKGVDKDGDGKDDQKLICEIPVLEEHTHTADCFREVEAAEAEDGSAAEEADGQTTDGEDGSENITQEAEQTGETDETADALESVYEDDTIKVTATYTEAANIPEGAELKVEQITEESDPDHYAQRMQEAQEAAESLQPTALLKVGFYLADGTEVEPAEPVDLTVQFKDESGATVGDKMTIVHFGEEGTEVLSGSELDENAATTFTMDSFSEIVIGPELVNGSTGGNSGDGIMTITGNGGTTNFEHNKRIDYLGNNGTGSGKTDDDNKDTTADTQKVTDDLYRLYLDMEGKSEPIDLVIVIDRSDSMKEKMSSGKTRWQTVYDILEGTQNDGSDGLLKQFLAANVGKTSNAEKNFVSVVWFAGQFYDRNKSAYGSATNTIPPSSSNEGGTVFGWTSDYTRHGNTNYKISPDKGVSWGVACTNYVAGMYQADQKLHNLPAGTENHRKVVVFMSDGIPVYYYMAKDMNWGNPSGMHRYGGGAEGYTYVDWSGSNLIYNYNNNKNHKAASFYKSPYFNETLKIFNGASNSFVSRNPNVGFHTVAIDLAGEKINGWDRTTLLKDMAKSYTGGTTFSATNAAGLKQYLQSIMFPAGVTISDDLSAYVDLYKDLPDIRVTATPKKGGDEIVLWSTNGPAMFGSDGKITGSHTNKMVEGTTAQNIVDYVTYDSSTKTIAVKFKKEYCFSGDYTYTLSFNVKLTDAAYNAYAKEINQTGSGYTDTGDAETDYKVNNNRTSSGQKGLHSNDKATVEYTVGDKTGSLEYDHPVVQAWGSKFQIHKVDENGNALSGMSFKLANTRTGRPVTPQNANKDTKNNNYYLTDASGNLVFGGLEIGEYTLTEKIPDGYENAGKEIEVATFEVYKGRIINMKTVAGVAKWNGTNNYDKTKDNNIPNTSYEDGEIALTVTNKHITRPIAIYKVDSKGQNLKGAKFELKKANVEGNIWTKDNTTVVWAGGDKTSDAAGLVYDGDIPYGTYILTEKAAPKNYIAYENSIGIIVGNDDIQMVVLTTTDGNTFQAGGTLSTAKNNENPWTVMDGEKIKLTVPNDLDVVRVRIKKTDMDYEALGGVKFGIYDSDPTGASAKPLHTGISAGDTGILQENGADITLELLPGTYYVKELEAKEGYNTLKNAIVIEVDENRHVTVTSADGDQYVKYPSDQSELDVIEIIIKNSTGYILPETGGIGTTTMYTLGGLLLVIAAITLLYKSRSKEREGKS